MVLMVLVELFKLGLWERQLDTRISQGFRSNMYIGGVQVLKVLQHACRLWTEYTALALLSGRDLKSHDRVHRSVVSTSTPAGK